MSRLSIDRLHDIVSSAGLAQRYAEGLGLEAFSSDEERRDAALFRLGIVCEAATHLPTFKRSHLRSHGPIFAGCGITLFIAIGRSISASYFALSGTTLDRSRKLRRG
jgi:hypothetical protein